MTVLLRLSRSIHTGGDLLADNRRATREFGEPLHAGHFGGRSLWYTWTAEKTGRLEVLAPAANYLLLAAYLGDAVTNLSEVASAFIEQSGRLKFRVQGGQEYKIAVDNAWGYGTETLLSFGQTQLNVAFSADPVPSELTAIMSETGTLLLTARGEQSAILETTTDFTEWAAISTPPIAPLTWRIQIDDQLFRFFRLRIPDLKP